MKSVINVYKPIGKTPLEVVEQFRQLYPEVRDKKIAYAGRLDPMAHGVLLLLIEPETKKRSTYQNLDKSYTFDLILGIETDTHDLMGIATANKVNIIPKDCVEKALQVISSLMGTHQQSYPIYSSKTVKGKSLYWWARQGELDKITIPSKKITIHNIEIVKTGENTINELSKEAVHKIMSVKGDFRQETIQARWDKLSSQNGNETVPRITIKLTCSSGTYVREIANRIGKELKLGGLCADIFRTRVGDYDIEKSLKLQFIS